ncbi:unnamed protein product [Adineta steineri]|uniref:G-protein coupled receptors family 1 profile domain-containing protein n=2 Tax=Adineta steineri TaxID=433720 RepID=A0A818LDV6_9BILA|nr:unnamed protein product [Adineta steineri]CAF3572798.1 unnamed protein product [Adineta steineri]
MSGDLFSILWFILFITMILIALVANIIIILAILTDKSMHTSTYFYIINVDIADIVLVLSCLPERMDALFSSGDGFHLGIFVCYSIPFLQQVAMHAALIFLLILTVHRCYPAGVPHCLQGNLIRRQIRNYPQTSCLIWIFAILINLPLFFITKYEKHIIIEIENKTNTSQTILFPTCDTEAKEIWSRTYLILLLVCTYLITGIFLIVIYGQVIRIILTSNRYVNKTKENKSNSSEQYRFLSPNLINQVKSRDISTSSSSAKSSSRAQQQRTSSCTPPILIMIPMGKNNRSTNSHSFQHLQVIIMLFTLILLYIFLLLPYRLFNLLFIVYNSLFSHHFMNEILFHCLLNIVRLLVFLNCALQPIIYLIMSSRLRQAVIKFFQTCCYKYYCQCQCAISHKTSNQDIRLYQNRNYQPNKVVFRDRHQYVPSRNNVHMTECQTVPSSRSPLIHIQLANKTPYTVTMRNSLRK